MALPTYRDLPLKYSQMIYKRANHIAVPNKSFKGAKA